MVLERDFPTTPPDIRVEKESRSLLRAGHEIDMLSLKITSPENHARVEGVQVFRVPIPMLRIRDWDEAGVEELFHSPESPWVAAIEGFIDRQKPEVLHVHDLPLVWSSEYAARRKGIPIIFDMHEIYPPLVRFMRPGDHDSGGWKASEWVNGYERECLAQADRIIVVVEESRQRLLRMGIPKDRIAVVMNTEDLERMRAVAPPDRPVSDLHGKFLLTYVGTFGEIRGLELLVDALPALLPRVPNLHLLLVGGEYNQPALEAMADERGVREHVTITGWVEFREIPYYIAISDVCAVPHIRNEFTDATIPHKLFQYMCMGKPVVVSDAAPLARIVCECRCGTVFPSGRTGAVAEAVLELSLDPHRRERMGENGRRAAVEKYNWGTDQRNLLCLYEGLGRA
ncbi:MAG: glycosyltransferase family 4 protein [Thermodesulfobacteriota bacterium]